MKMDSIAIV